MKRYEEQPEEIYVTNDFSVLASDEMLGYNELRTIEILKDNKRTRIGAYFLNPMETTSEWMKINERAIAILSIPIMEENPNIIIETLFDIASMTFVKGTPEELLSAYQSLFYASEKQDEKGFQKIKK